MKVGIKFCGGCNPRYDRGSEYQKLTKECPKVQWIRGNDKEICDYWLAICGCSRECLDISGLVARKKVFILESPMDFQKVKEMILESEEKDKVNKRKSLYLGESASMEIQITNELLHGFSNLTKDYNKMHTDKAFAANQWFQKPVMHGMFMASFLSSVMGMKLPGDGTILMEESTIFQKPVFLDDTITATITFDGYKEEGIYYLGTFLGECKNQNGEIVTQMKAKQMMMKNLFEIKN